MKKIYETPSVEVVKFEYKDQVVATSGCINTYGEMGAIGQNDCDNWHEIEHKN